MSPEVLEDMDGYDSKADIWSLGITALELAQGHPPYSEVSTMKAIVKIIEEDPPQLNKKDGWDEGLIEFINCCLKKDPTKRNTASELLKLKFIQKSRSIDYIKEKLINGLK